MNYAAKDTHKIDSAIAAAIIESRNRLTPSYSVGSVIKGLDVRLGGEGPDSWTRFAELTVEPRHVAMADEMERQ